MQTKTYRLITTLGKIARSFDESANRNQKLILGKLSLLKLPEGKKLLAYHELLLFLAAFPYDEAHYSAVHGELQRITSFLKKSTPGQKTVLLNSGLPYSDSISSFSYDFICWIREHLNARISIERFEDSGIDINDLLRLVLPSLLRAETTAGLNADGLYAALAVPPNRRLDFLLTEFSKLSDKPFILDYLFDKLSMVLRYSPTDKTFSRTYNRFTGHPVYFHRGLRKKRKVDELINSPVGKNKRLSSVQAASLIKTLKQSMALTDRETDTVSYLDESTLRYYVLEDGISVALYGMTAERQLPLETYVGYTLFKNGYPAAYGGGWVFGKRADFGINVFETFRGGESSTMLGQLLRVYRQVFGSTCFHVEAYQLGADNEEGITSGAFWFYYRHGFRPVQRKLNRIAAEEWKKISERKGYRTAKSTLRKLASGGVILNLEKKYPPGLYEITNRIIRMISIDFSNNTMKAEAGCLTPFLRATGLHPANPVEKGVITDYAMWAKASKIRSREKLKLMTQLVKTRTTDIYKYQRLLIKFLE